MATRLPSREPDRSGAPAGVDVETVISVRGLRMSYDGLEAVRGVDLHVCRGEVFAFLGPNGAGKTTSVEILEGFRQRTGGDVTVLGEDPQRAGGYLALADRGRAAGVAARTGTECAGVPDALRRLLPKPRPVGETLDLVGLADRANARSGRLSGGQRRRLDVALALIGDPDLTLLDEPTTGFDPAARRAAWEVIAGLQALDKTVFLTTHYMDEAEYLADRIMVIAAGQIVAEGTPATLGGRAGAAAQITFTLPPEMSPADLPRSADLVEHAQGAQVRLRSESALTDVAALATWAAERRIDLPDLQVTRPTLEDIYLRLVAGAS